MALLAGLTLPASPAFAQDYCDVESCQAVEVDVSGGDPWFSGDVSSPSGSPPQSGSGVSTAPGPAPPSSSIQALRQKFGTNLPIVEKDATDYLPNVNECGTTGGENFSPFYDQDGQLINYSPSDRRTPEPQGNFVAASGAPVPATEPVAGNGEFVVEETDLALPGIGIPFRFTRYYRSGINFQGDLGFGWNHNFARHILSSTTSFETLFSCNPEGRELGRYYARPVSTEPSAIQPGDFLVGWMTAPVRASGSIVATDLERMAAGTAETIGDDAIAATAESLDAAIGAPNLTAANDVFGTYASRATPLPGYTDVIVHGSKTEFYQTPTSPEIGHRVVAQMLANDASYSGGPIRLIACEAGACGSTTAQNLANKLGVEVLAPSDTVWAFPSGQLVIGPSPTIPSGSWISFKPGGP